jgi:deoxyribonuclease V
MIAIVDVQYEGDRARAGCAVIADWGDDAAVREVAVEVEGVAEYVPGELYRRELPALLRVLEGVAADVIVVDGYVWLGEGRPGLGARLHEALGVAVVGVAKSEFAGASAIPVVRGESARPLWVTAVGIDAAEAARQVAAMHGEFRLPTMIVRADHLARGLEQ